MNKAQLIEAIAADVNLPKTVASRALDAVLKNIESTLVAGEEVVLVGFGTFSAKKRAARTGRNPKTGEEISIPETIIPYFKPGKAFKEAVASAELELAE